MLIRVRIEGIMGSLNKSQEKAVVIQKQICEMESRIIELEKVEKEYQRSLQILNIKYMITKLLAESTSVDKVYEKVIQIICETLNFEVGMSWSYESTDNQLFCSKVWQLPKKELIEFEEISWQHKFLPGIGLPGRLLASGEPSWIVDLVKDNNFLRAPVAKKVGLQSGFGFPILIGYQVLGTMEFFTSQRQSPDNKLLELMSVIGNQIGEFNWHNWHGKTTSSAYFC